MILVLMAVLVVVPMVVPMVVVKEWFWWRKKKVGQKRCAVFCKFPLVQRS